MEGDNCIAEVLHEVVTPCSLDIFKGSIAQFADIGNDPVAAVHRGGHFVKMLLYRNIYRGGSLGFPQLTAVRRRQVHRKLLNLFKVCTCTCVDSRASKGLCSIP